jgi:hypothetical protein
MTNVHRTFRMRLFALSIALFLAFTVATANATARTVEVSAKAESTPDPLAEKWGIDITGIHMSAHNYMVDFRYRVLDAEKAKALFDRQTKPYLIDQTSGKVLAVPNTAKLGPLRNSNQPKEGKIYWMFFGNRGGIVDTGSKVTVKIGDFEAKNLVIK